MLPAARARGMYSRSEAAAAVMLLLLFSVVAMAVVAELWAVAAIFAAATLALVGILAVFAARRSRLVAERVVGQMERQGVSLATKLATQTYALPGVAPLVKAQTTAVVEPTEMPVVALVASDYVASDHFRSYLELAARMPDHRWLDNTILRNASIVGRDLLAWHASGGRYTYRQLEGWLALLRDHTGCARAKAALETLDVDWSLRLARVVTLQSLQADDRLNALTLYRLVYVVHGPAAIKPSHTHGRVFQALAYDAGEYGLAREISRRVRCAGSDLPFMRADLLNPFTPSPFADPVAWLEEVNQNFVSTGLEPIALDMGDAAHHPFDRVRCVASDCIDTGPLVTVVVSAWQPDHGLSTAIDSLLAQSWRPLEILIVDDASPEAYRPVIDQVAALDPRIRVIRQARNGGTYVARNTAMQEAKGEFMTFLDSDDWCHPRRIERQVDLLADNPELMSTTSRALRTNQNLVFNLPGVLAQRENASSLMFRLAPARERVGYFDTVRKAADSEYALRLRRAFGADSHRIVEENLALIRMTAGSLSREEFKPGWRHPSRAAYRRNYEHWHRASIDSGAGLFAHADLDRRVFPAPNRFMVERDGAEIQRRSAFDVVFVADLRHGEESLRTMFDEMRACQHAGAKVAVIHMESFRHMARIELELFWPPIQDAIARGEIDEILLTDTAAIGTVVVRNPAVLQFPSLQRCALQVDRVVVVAESPPREITGSLWYVPSECMRNAQSIFGARVTWVAQSLRVRMALRERLPKSALKAEPLPVAVEVSALACPTRRANSKAPVIGRMSSDSPGNFPGRASTLLAAYPVDGRYDVRMLGGRAACDALLGYRPLPDNWSFPDPAEVSIAAFLATCDFFVYFDRKNRKPQPLRRLLEAMASGCVVILPVKFASLFADAAVYCEPTEVREVVDKFAADATLFEAQSLRARQYVAHAHDPARFAHALREFTHQTWPAGQ